jgi:ketosteroid isomerase-like protein
MADEEVEIVTALVGSFAAGADEVQRLKGLIAEDAEQRPLRARLEAKTYVGPEGWVDFYEDLMTDWEELSVPIDEIRRAGDLVVALLRLVARGRASGTRVEVRIGTVWEVRDGLVRRVESFSEPDDALRAAGLLDP